MTTLIVSVAGAYFREGRAKRMKFPDHQDPAKISFPLSIRP
jgi:hypothetical protein